MKLAEQWNRRKPHQPFSKALYRQSHSKFLEAGFLQYVSKAAIALHGIGECAYLRISKELARKFFFDTAVV